MRKEVSTKQKILNTITFLLIFIGGIVSYFSYSGPIKIGAYILSLMGLLILPILWSIKSLSKFIIVLIFVVLIGIFSLLPILLTSSHFTFTDFQQGILYPITIFILLMYGYRILYIKFSIIVKVLIFIGILNAMIAILGSFGIISSIPFLGEVRTGRYVFGTTIPASPGLNFNLNYFSTTQATIFLLVILLKYISKNDYTKKERLFVIIIFLSALWGSSRGVLIALIGVAIFLGGIKFYYSNVFKKSKIIYILIIFSIILLFWISKNFNQIELFIMQDLRFEKGVNGRDDIWKVGLDRWKERPILGWGSMAFVANDFIAMTGNSLSLHNSYINTLYRGGILLFLSIYGLKIYCILCNVLKIKDYFYLNRFNIAIVIFFLINTSIRNFQFGGVGLLPLSLGISLSLCLYSNELKKQFL